MNTSDKKHFTPLQRVTAFRRAGNSVEVTVDGALLRVDVLRPEIIRLKITRSGVFDENPTFAVSKELASSAAFELIETDGAIQIITTQMRFVVGKAPFHLDAYRADGSVIFETADCGDSCGAYAYLNDEFLVTRKNRKEDVILGLGEKTGRMNRNGRSFTLWNTDVLSPDAAGEFANAYDKSDPRSDRTSTQFDPYYVSIPFYYHVSHRTGKAAGFFIDNGYRAYFDFEAAGHSRFRFTGGQYTEYIFAGPSLSQILTDYTELTGRMNVPPLWALGYHQCRWHSYTQSMVEGLACTMREHEMPCDSLWLDIQYMDGYRVFTWDHKNYPDPAGFVNKLRRHGLRAVTIIDPGVKVEPGYSVYDDGLNRDVFCRTAGGVVYTGQVWPGRTAFPDFVKEEARRWWGEQNARHIESGLAGIWNDMNEPATGDIRETAMRFGGGRYPHEQYHNQYALLMAMSTMEGLRAAQPQMRTFILSRAGSPGIQRYAANWMGDNMARWDHLWMSMPMALGLGLSGQPFVGGDVGGFMEDTNPELFLRWMQCGTLTPFCRNHSNFGQRDQYPWSFGKPILDLCRKSLELRYRLMPMLYSAFVRSSETGLPVQRPLALDYQNDITTLDIDDQYLLGEHLLVAPVYEPHVTARHVYLPEGTWHHWFTGEVLTGGQFTLAQTPMDQIPLYAKGGSVIPMWPHAPLSTMNYHPRSIELHLFVPQEDGEYRSVLQEDDGTTFVFQDGAHYRTEMVVRREGGGLSLEATVTGRGYPEFDREEFVVVVHGAAPQTALADGWPTIVEGDTIRLRNSGQPFTLEFAY